MQQVDTILASAVEDVKKVAAVYVADIADVPELIHAYKLYDAFSVMLYFRSTLIRFSDNSAINHSINWGFKEMYKDAECFLDIIDSAYMGTRRGGYLTETPFGYKWYTEELTTRLYDDYLEEDLAKVIR